MSEISQRHYLRIDTATQDALEQLCRHLFTTKSELMRRYVREGVAREAQEYAASVEQVKRSKRILTTI